jgi:hypothetical protein
MYPFILFPWVLLSTKFSAKTQGKSICLFWKFPLLFSGKFHRETRRSELEFRINPESKA